jgi:hypothetical protein
VDEGRRVAERRLDRDGLAATRNGSGERDDAARGREHVRASRGSEVHATVLPGRIRMRMVERERTKDRAVDRPGPRLCRANGQEQRAERNDSNSPDHESLLVARLEN